jgi:hypothetical protein
MNHVVDRAGLPVERAVHAELPVRAGGRHLGTDSPEHPHLGQLRVEMNLTFVEEEEIEGVARVDRVFLRRPRCAVERRADPAGESPAPVTVAPAG